MHLLPEWLLREHKSPTVGVSISHKRAKKQPYCIVVLNSPSDFSTQLLDTLVGALQYYAF